MELREKLACWGKESRHDAPALVEWDLITGDVDPEYCANPMLRIAMLSDTYVQYMRSNVAIYKCAICQLAR